MRSLPHPTDRPLSSEATPQPGTDEGSTLCLECGLCCRGAIHAKAVLFDEDRSLARELVLRVIATPDGPRFRLPCHHHVDGRCTTYDNRPRVCHEYQCKLLGRLLSGRLSLADCLDRVHHVQNLVATLQKTTGVPAAQVSIWGHMRRWLSDPSNAKDRNARLDAGELLIFLKKEFVPEQEESEG